MRSSFFRIAAAAVGLMLLVSVIPALGDDYLVIKRKAARNRKFPWSSRLIRSSPSSGTRRASGKG